MQNNGLEGKKLLILGGNPETTPLVIDAILGKICRVPVVIGHSHNTCFSVFLHAACKKIVNIFVDNRFACSRAAGEWILGNGMILLLSIMRLMLNNLPIIH